MVVIVADGRKLCRSSKKIYLRAVENIRKVYK
jgi:hypothetical protein